MNRRIFISRTALFATFFKPFAMFGNIETARGLTDDQWRTAVDYARWCPTVHNLQPQRIEITSKQTAKLFYESNRLLPIGDPKCVFTQMALGIFIENLSIAMAPYGKEIRIDKIHNSVDFTKKGLVYFADLLVVNTTKAKDINRELILKRRTSRGKYSGEPLAKSTLQKIAKEAARFGHKIKWSSNDAFVDFMTNLNQKTLFEDLKRDDFRKELDGLFRYDKETAALKKDGLSAKCMGFAGWLMRSVFQKPEKWVKGIRKKLLWKQYAKTFKGTRTLVWITGKFETPDDFLQAGKMFARIWLLITEAGGYLQPFGSLITNEVSFEQIKKELSIPKNELPLWFIFRAGYSEEPAKSKRLDLNTILLNKDFADSVNSDIQS